MFRIQSDALGAHDTAAIGRNAPLPDRSPLENSQPLPWNLACTADLWQDALDTLLARLETKQGRQRGFKTADRVRHRETLGAVVLALYAAHKADAGRWLAYSRSNNSYGPMAIYTHPMATARAVVAAADFLAAEDLAEHRTGFFDRSPNAFGGAGGRGFLSRIRATHALADLLEGSFNIRRETLQHADWAPLVRLKGPAPSFRAAKPLVPYRDTPETLRMSKELRELNAFLGGFRIDLEAGPVADDGGGDDALELTDRSTAHLYRSFNNGRWDHGGRFFGGWWQNLSKQDRGGLLIDGEVTLELDFKSMHPRLCYDLEGKPLPRCADPYKLEGFGGPRERDLVKVAFNQLLNVKPTANPRAPAGAREVLAGRMTYRALTARIEAEHSAIRQWFRSGRGVELQFIDSEIAASVLQFFKAEGICCLPVHDSFVVPRSAEVLLGQAMCMAYATVLAGRGGSTTIPVISGWSSPDAEARALAPFSRDG